MKIETFTWYDKPLHYSLYIIGEKGWESTLQRLINAIYYDLETSMHWLSNSWPITSMEN